MSSTYIASVLKFALYSNLGKAVKEVIKEFNDHPPVDITVLQHSFVELNKRRLINTMSYVIHAPGKHFPSNPPSELLSIQLMSSLLVS